MEGSVCGHLHHTTHPPHVVLFLALGLFCYWYFTFCCLISTSWPWELTMAPVKVCP